jgi:hypothetical protein
LRDTPVVHCQARSTRILATKGGMP